jgi:SAM-dependent methyltransferase
MEAPETLHFFDRYDRFGSPDDFRSRHRYEAIVSCQSELYRDARVLNLHSGDGRWCMAALDAGAAHVAGVDPSRRAVETARTNFIEYGITSEAYQFTVSDINTALRATQPGAFDLVVFARSFELSDPRVVFGQIYRIEAKHVILDTDVSRGEGPIVRFDVQLRDKSASEGTQRRGSVTATPNHELIAFLCEYFQFGWSEVDWQTLGITDWSGAHDYERGRRSTYVLERL